MKMNNSRPVSWNASVHTNANSSIDKRNDNLSVRENLSKNALILSSRKKKSDSVPAF